MKTEDFLDILQDRQLVAEAILAQLRDKLSQGDRRITPKSILKYLVKKELITRSRAKQLLETTLTVSPHAESSILGVVPMPLAPSERPSPPARDEEEIPTLAPIDPNDVQRITDDARKKVEAEEHGAALSGFLSETLDEPTASQPTAPPATGQRPAKSRQRRKQPKKNEWDSSLMLLGGGGLALLVIVGVVTAILLYRDDAEAILSGASEFFDGGSYTQSIKQYERFVESFPRHPEISAATVRLGMARLWKATSGTSNYSAALLTAQQVIEDIKDEDEFHLAQRDLAARLPVIAEGLANRAEQATDPQRIQELVDQATTALAICNNTKFIPKTFRDPVLEEISKTLDRVERGRQQLQGLKQALADIQAAIEKPDVAAAYAIHRQTLEKYPTLINDPTLLEKILEVSAAEKSVIEFVAKSQIATTETRPSSVVATVTLADRSGAPVEGVDRSVAVRIDGAVYGLRGADGALLWRQFVGIDPRAALLTLPDGDLVAIDAAHHDLLRLKAETGKLVWRLELGAPMASPIALGEKLLVVDGSGKLHVINAANGERIGYVQFAQSLSVSPTIGAHGRRLYLVGEHSSLYTLSTDDFSCLGVFYLGHPKGSLSTPPVTVLDKVVVAINVGVQTSQLKVLSTAADGLVTELAASRRLDGLVNTPLLVQGRRLAVLTTHGQVAVYEIGSGAGDAALTDLAIRDPEKGLPVARFGWMHKGHIWSAGRQLSKLAILPTNRQLQVRTIDDDHAGDVFDQRLQMINDLLVHVRRPRGQGGVVVAVVDTGSGQTKWETELAVPLAGAPAVDSVGNRITAMTATGKGYVLDRDALGRRIQDQAARSSVLPGRLSALTECVDLGSGRLAGTSIGAKSILRFQPDATRNAVQSVKLASAVSCRPAVWRDALVVPTEVGQVFLFGGENGRQVAEPFQPPSFPGQKYEWLTPAVIGSGDQSRMALCDRRTRIYLVELADAPQPHLKTVAKADVSRSPLNTRLAVLGETLCAGADDRTLAVFALPSLEAKRSVELDARIVWGPYAAGDYLVCATDTDELLAVDRSLQVVWRRPLDHGPPTGAPLADGAEVIVAWSAGGLSRCQLQDGTEVGYQPLQQPVVHGPVAFGRRLVLAAADGTLLVVNRP